VGRNKSKLAASSSPIHAIDELDTAGPGADDVCTMQPVAKLAMPVALYMHIYRLIDAVYAQRTGMETSQGNSR
jgi:hypothetical protein